MTAIVWPSVTVVRFSESEGVVWRSGKPYCATHQGVCLVKASTVGAQTDGGTHICPDCMRAWRDAENGSSEASR